MPACSCQHFQSGSNVVPSPPPLCELMRQGAEGGGASLCWNGGGAKSGGMATTGLFTLSLPGWHREDDRGVTHIRSSCFLAEPACQPQRVAIFMRRETACPHCCCGECQRGAKEKGRRCCASAHLVLVDCCVKASADSRSMSLATKYDSLGLW